MESLTLFELNNLVRSVLEQTLDDAYWIEAELSEARLASNGHFYVEFVEKDASGRNTVAKARGTIWARTYHMLAPLFERATGERLRAGMKVRVRVTVEFHELYGYTLNVIEIDPSYTLGDLAKRRREILQQLEADGILHDNQQLPLPALLKRIAVVSSASAAGYGDFCDQLQHNDYGLSFKAQLFPAVMQGGNVEESVTAALAAIMEEADRWDCVVIIRGGGATSDLADFDTYNLAAAVAQMPVPVIVGIGHERDETVLDFVAHTRVKTPTAAAAFLIDHGAQQLARLEEWQKEILQGARLKIEGCRQQFTRLATLLPQAFSLVQERQQRRIDQLALRLTHAPKQQLLAADHQLQLTKQRLAQSAKLSMQSAKNQVEKMEQRMAALDPILMLQRGYSLTYDENGKLVRSVTELHVGAKLTTRLADGHVTAEVTQTSHE